MPSRPALPRYLSLTRSKSGGQVSAATNSIPTTPPPTNGRHPSPHRNGSNIKSTMTNSHQKATGDPRGDHKGMGLVLRVQVVKGRNLAAKDKSGYSDPYLVLSVAETRQATSYKLKNLNPEWNETFEFPITSPDCASLVAVCWDKDRFRKDYMGEFDVSLEELFGSGSPSPEAQWFRLEGRRSDRKKKKDANISGEVQLKFTLLDPVNTAAEPQHIISKLAGIIADPGEEDEEDEEMLAQLQISDAGELDEDEDEKEALDHFDTGTSTPIGQTEQQQKSHRREKIKKLKQKRKLRSYEFGGASDVAGVLYLEIKKITDLPPEKNMTKTTFDMDPFVVTSLGKKTYRTRVVNHNLNPVYDEKLVFQVQKHELNFSLSFTVVDRDKFSGNDFVGTVALPVEQIRALSPEADPDTGLYKLPDVDNIAEGGERRRRFRMPMSRSTSQNNLGKISRNSSANNLKTLALTAAPAGPQIYGRPPLTHGVSEVSTLDYSKSTSSQVPTLSQFSSNGHEEHDGLDEAGLTAFELPLELKNKQRWEDKHHPRIYIRAKYLPYQALRQQFWRVLLRQYDADESGRIDKVELVTMLDTLGSTLHNATIDSFYQRWADVNGGSDFLTMDQAVICLEEQLMKTPAHNHKTDPNYWKRKLSSKYTSSPEQSPVGGSTPYLNGSDNAADLQPGTAEIPTLEVSDLNDNGMPKTLVVNAGDPLSDLDLEGDLNDDPHTKEERVVEIHECPICHQPRLSRGRRTTDADIITHIATCASSDWRAVNNLVMAGFVTTSQAQRKWYSKVISKVSYGGYKLGANSANILVQDRTTGMINEERMSVYVRLGIRLLYKGFKSNNMELKQVRKLLRSLSIKQGRKYDDPASAAQIPGFINFHQLDMSEVLRPTEEFKTFNEFFYRELKPNARPCSAPDDPHIIVSPADCRSVVFNRLDEAQSIWVKGREFSVERLLGDAYPQETGRYKNGALGIMRLAPQDYHRFHIPVDGVMGEPKLIEGEYYTVNPMAIRSALDVYGENVRVCVPIDSVCHGKVMVICVGAMMVGSTVITRKAGEHVKRAEELGYFKFGGSTLLLLFEPGAMQFDEDLVANSKGALETLIRVGMSVGRTPSHAPHTPDMQKANPTQAEKEEARRKIEGSLSQSTGSKMM